MSKKILKTVLSMILLVIFLHSPVVKAAPNVKYSLGNESSVVTSTLSTSRGGQLKVSGLILASCSPVNNDNDFSCRNANIQNAVKVIANILFYIRILVPIVVVIIGTVNFAKAILSQDDNDIKAVFYDLMKKIVIGVLIFVIPTIIISIMKNVASAQYNKKSNWTCCVELLK